MYINMSGDLTALIRDIREIPGNTSREFGRTMKNSADKILSDAKSRASWSTRIPGALSVRVTPTSSARPGIMIMGATNKAPHLRVWEGFVGGKKSKTFRHPLFGNKNYWYTQNARPFITPAVRAGVDDFRNDVAEAAVAAYKKAGFK